MNRIMPTIRESADELKHRLQQERDPRRRQRCGRCMRRKGGWMAGWFPQSWLLFCCW